MDVFFAFPPILLAIGIAAVLGAGPGHRDGRPSRSSTRRSSSASSAAACWPSRPRPTWRPPRRWGSGRLGILFRHVLPNVDLADRVQTAVCLSYGILIESALSYLGVGVQPPTPSWGAILNEGKEFLALAPVGVALPGRGHHAGGAGAERVGATGLRDALDPASRDEVTHDLRAERQDRRPDRRRAGRVPGRALERRASPPSRPRAGPTWRPVWYEFERATARFLVVGRERADGSPTSARTRAWPSTWPTTCTPSTRACRCRRPRAILEGPSRPRRARAARADPPALAALPGPRRPALRRAHHRPAARAGAPRAGALDHLDRPGVAPALPLT